MIALLPFACSHHCPHHLSCCHHDDDPFPGVPTHSLIWPLPWSHPLPSHSCTSWSNIWGWCKRPFNQVMEMIRRGAFYRCCPDPSWSWSWSLFWAGKMRRPHQPVQLQLCHYQAWGFFLMVVVVMMLVVVMHCITGVMNIAYIGDGASDLRKPGGTNHSQWLEVKICHNQQSV